MAEDFKSPTIPVAPLATPAPPAAEAGPIAPQAPEPKAPVPGKVEPPEPAASPPAPAELYELYPGQAAETDEWQPIKAELIQQQNTALQDKEKWLNIKKWVDTIPGPSVPEWVRGLMPQWAIFFGSGNVNAKIEEKLAIIELELDTAQASYDSYQWKENAIFSINGLYNFQGARTVDDMLPFLEKKYPVTDAEKAWLQQLIDKTQYLLPKELPDNIKGEDAAQTRQNLYEALMAEEKVGLDAVHNLSVKEIAKAFTIKLPDMEGVPERLSALDILADDPAYAEDKATYMEQMLQYQLDRKKEIVMQTAIREGLVNFEAEELTVGQKAKMFFSQPMLMGLEAYDWWMDRSARPLQAWAVTTTHKLFGTTGINGQKNDASYLNDIYEEKLDEGFTGVKAYTEAWHDWDTNTATKLLGEIFLDPLNLVGLGILPKIFTKVPLLFKTATAVELGWNTTMSLPFKGMKAVLSGTGKGLGVFKTPFQHAVKYSYRGLDTIDHYLLQDTGKGWIGQTAETLNNSLNKAVEAFRVNPQGFDFPHQVGKFLTDHPMMTKAEIRFAYQEATGVIPNGIDDIAFRAQVNETFEQWWRLGDSPHPVEYWAEEILKAGGVHNASEEVLGNMVKFMNAHKEEIFGKAKRLIDNATPKSTYTKIREFILDGNLAYQQDELFMFWKKRGELTSWITTRIDSLTRTGWLANLERKFVGPMANLFLQFPMFGPMNYVEAIYRNLAAHAAIVHPRGAIPSAEVARVMQGLENRIHKFDGFADDALRSSPIMGVSDSRTGHIRTSSSGVFGQIPFLSRSYSRFGLDKIKLTTPSIYGRKFEFRTWLDTTAAWNVIGSEMQATYIVSKYKQNLIMAAAEASGKTGVNTLDDITKIFDDHQSTLDGIKKFSKKDKSEIRRVLEQDATVSPELISDMLNVPVDMLENRKALEFIKDELARTTGIMSTHQEYIVDKVLDGTIWTQTDEVFENVFRSMQEYEVFGLQMEKEALEQFAENLSKVEIKTVDDALAVTANIENMADGIMERVHEFNKTVQSRGIELRPGEKDKFFGVSTRLMQDFLATSEYQLNRIRNHVGPTLEALTKGIGATGDNAYKSYLDLTAKQGQRHSAAIKARTDEQIFIQERMKATPPRNRDDVFWSDLQRGRSQIWDSYYATEMQLFEDANKLRAKAMSAFGKDTPNLATRIYKVDKLAPADIADLFRTTGDDLESSLTTVGATTKVRQKARWVSWVKSHADIVASRGGIADATDLGWTREAIEDVYDQLWKRNGFDPVKLTDDIAKTGDSLLVELQTQLNSLKASVNQAKMAKSLTPDDFAGYQKYLKGVSDDLAANPAFKKGSPEAAAWHQTRENAMKETKVGFEMDYPDYDPANSSAVDAMMKTIFPFWTYESQRWFYLGYQTATRPAVMMGMAKYMNYTDEGYMRVPGTNLQVNLLRGSVFMGGMRRLFKKDYPEYDDAVPGIEQLDYIGRLGFYPGAHVMTIKTLVGSIADKKARYGELLPPFAKAGMNVMREIFPKTVGPIIDRYFPDGFREYKINMALRLLESSEGYNENIWNKREQGKTLTPEEEDLWNRAGQMVDGVAGAIQEATGMLRWRPQEFTDDIAERYEVLSQMTGVPAEVIKDIDRKKAVTGKGFSDYYHLDELQLDWYYKLESVKRWSGLITPLLPGAWQAVEIQIDEAWKAAGDIREDAMYNGLKDPKTGEITHKPMAQIEQEVYDGVTSPGQWRSSYSDMLAAIGVATNAMFNEVYTDVPLTHEARAAHYAKKGEPMPTWSWDKEMHWEYQNLSPEMKWQWDTGKQELDLDEYYFKINLMLSVMDKDIQDQFVKTMQSDWTDLSKLYWQVNRDYLRMHYLARGVVLEQYSDEQRAIIAQFEAARGDERTRLQAIESEEGRALVSEFGTKLSDFRKNMRYAYPDLDAWLHFWGKTDKLLTTKSQELYKAYSLEYLGR